MKKAITEAIFADDFTLRAHKESDLKLIIDKFAEAFCLFDITINLKKNRGPATACPSFHCSPPYISIEGT